MREIKPWAEEGNRPASQPANTCSSDGAGRKATVLKILPPPPPHTLCDVVLGLLFLKLKPVIKAERFLLSGHRLG